MISVDRIDAFGIAGWAWTEGADAPELLELQVCSVTLATAEASLFRDDLRFLTADGRAGFEFRFDPSFLSFLPPDAPCRIMTSAGETVEIRLPGTGTEAFRGVNEAGERLTLNKDGYLTVRFCDMLPDNLDLVAAFTRRVMDDLASLGYPAFLAYGTLLGCVREGQFIGHDDDVDLGVHVGPAASPQEVDELSGRLLHGMQGLGYEVSRFSIGQLQVVRDHLHADLFLAWSEGDRFHLNFAIQGSLPSAAVFPLGTAPLRGLAMAVPNRVEDFCAATYGPSWRTPQSGFRWQRETLASVVDRDLRAGIDYWDAVYGSRAEAAPGVPSQFAVFCAAELRHLLGRAELLVDVGCGNARDTAFLSGHFGRALGLDGSAQVLQRNRAAHPDIAFMQCNLNDSLSCETVWARLQAALAQDGVRSACVYARFLLHAIDDYAQDRLMRLVHRLAHSVEVLVFAAEYRTPPDESRPKATSHHYRRYIDHRAMVELLGGMGLEVRYEVEGRGMAKHLEDDAVVGRVLAISRRPPAVPGTPATA